MAISNIDKKQHETCAIERDLVTLALRDLQAKLNTSLAKLKASHRNDTAHRLRIEATEATLAKISDILPAYSI